jgi:hypothetical protein
MNTPEKIKITMPCYVNGELKKEGDIVLVQGNDKAQLLSSRKGELLTESTKK